MKQFIQEKMKKQNCNINGKVVKLSIQIHFFYIISWRWYIRVELKFEFQPREVYISNITWLSSIVGTTKKPKNIANN